MNNTPRRRPMRSTSESTHRSAAPENNDVPLFDLSLMLYHVRSGIRRFGWLVLVLASLCAGFFCIREVRSYTPIYRAESILTVSVDVSAVSNYYNIATARQMAESLPHILSSSQLMDLIRDDLDISALNASVTASAEEGTNLFTIRVTSSDPKRAYDVLSAMLRLYPQVAEPVVGRTQIDLITEPILPTEPENPAAAVRGAAVGVALTAALIALYAVLDLTIVNAAGIENKLNGTCLARIPTAAPRDKKKQKKTGIYDLREADLNPAFCEAIRTLRHDVRRSFSNSSGSGKVLMLTSTSSNEGKSTVSINLAMSLAETGARVLLIDCDLRKPALKYHLGFTDETPGLAAILSRKAAFRDAVAVLPGTNLHILLSSSYSKHAAELFGTGAMDSFLKSLRTSYDYILLDTAPVALVSDTTALARHADAMIYIIRQDYVFTQHIYDAVRQLSSTGIELLGFVLNITSATYSSARYGYGYSVYGKSGRYGKYGYRYGYGRHKSSHSTDIEA